MWQPSLAITMGDVAGIGPEVVVRACANAEVRQSCRPIVVGHPTILERAARLIDSSIKVIEVSSIADSDHTSDVIGCWNPAGDAVLEVQPGEGSAVAGRAAYDYLVAAAGAALEQHVDAVTTAPLNKASLHLAGLNYPGHTEILAELCGVERFAMMLYLPADARVKSPRGLGVAHVTLHTSLASVPELLSTEGVREKIELLDAFMCDVGCLQPRIAVCALNPHGGEAGLFGDEESRIIAPAVEAAERSGIHVAGPHPADTLLRRAIGGEFDGVVAIYHDQGHIALKLIGLDRAVNVTLGLPIVRTSPSHGTAFDIAWRATASAEGMCEAIRVATLLAKQQHAQSSRRPG